MKKSLKSMLLMAVAVVMATVFAACNKDEVQSENYYTVSGKVVDTSGNPVSGALVKFTSQSGTYDFKPQFSSADGTFTIYQMKEGSKDVEVSKTNYITYSSKGVMVNAASTYFTFTLTPDPKSQFLTDLFDSLMK